MEVKVFFYCRFSPDGLTGKLCAGSRVSLFETSSIQIGVVGSSTSINGVFFDEFDQVLVFKWFRNIIIHAGSQTLFSISF